ncbi:muscarinic acetylcholine receptor DM1 [Cloeon dipterum]|uniref:muscarinic acetylcholine receptor DM1 n=1 Tax=Cloeon dipterum TaxID=197152 RepID=UPI003220168D
MAENATEAATLEPPAPYSLPETVLIAGLASTLSFLTVVGNIMVILSFKIDKQLQTISNYFLLSLAIADVTIGSVSMPLYTIYLLKGYWPFGPNVCDMWLALDYLASNASVLNLLIISFDRYFSVTRPLTYRAKRTTTKAAVMISSAWGISLLLWPPWIFSWPYIEGKRTVPDTACYIQFIETNHYITFGTAIAAFYVPVTVMIILYWRIWRETEKRKKDLPNLQAGKKECSKRSNSSDEAMDLEDWKRTRSESSTGPDEVDSQSFIAVPYRTCAVHGPTVNQQYHAPCSPSWIRYKCDLLASYLRCCFARTLGAGEAQQPPQHRFWRRRQQDLDTMSEAGYNTSVSMETSVPSSVSRCTSLNMIKDPYAVNPTARLAHYDPKQVTAGARTLTRSVSTESVYTILIRLPSENEKSELASIKMLPALDTGYPDATLRRHSSDVRIPLNAKIIPKQLIKSNFPLKKKKKKSNEKKADKKAAKTLSAILSVFIISWLPYNVLVLLKPLTSCEDCISQGVWDFFYFFCYINSTINPFCYALCNETFRKTYIKIIKCKWQSRNRAALNRGYYN